MPHAGGFFNNFPHLIHPITFLRLYSTAINFSLSSLSQIGNALVCLAVWSNHSMRTVTNIFIVNLAVADFFVILFCLPPTVIWDVTETWFLSETMCKVVIYFQVSINLCLLFSSPFLPVCWYQYLWARIHVYIKENLSHGLFLVHCEHINTLILGLNKQFANILKFNEAS